MDSISLWISITKRSQRYPTLNNHVTADVAIIGGGITGVTTALQLSQQGKNVVILESNVIGDGTTGHSTGNLYVLVQPYYQRILKHTNQNTVDSLIKMRLRAIDYIEQVVHSYQLKCNFLRRPSYLLTNEEKNISFLENEINLLRNAGVKCESVTKLDNALPFKKAVKIFNQARVNPLAYTLCIAQELNKKNIPLYEQTQIISIEEVDDEYLIKTDQGSVRAKHVVMATHIPKGKTVAPLLAHPFRSYAIAVKLKNKIASSGHYWQLNDPHNVISTQSNDLEHNEDDLVVIAGNHHKTGHDVNAKENFQKLETCLQKYYDIESVVYRWSAQHYQSADGVPYIGHTAKKKNIYIATGFYADGLVYGTAAATIITDLILKKENAISEIVAPYRITKPSALLTMTEETMDTFMHYAKDYLSPLQIKNLQDITPGNAKTIKINGERCGAYRDENGKLHVVSIVCTHMQCILKWNNAENSWDCPCHGSRFTFDGQMIEGPAYSNLKKMDIEES